MESLTPFRTDKKLDLMHILLKSNLISNLTQIRQECAFMWQIKPTVTTEDMIKFIENVRKRREYLQDIASEGLDKEDYEQLKKLIEDSLNNYFKEYDLKKRKWVEQEI